MEEVIGIVGPVHVARSVVAIQLTDFYTRRALSAALPYNVWREGQKIVWSEKVTLERIHRGQAVVSFLDANGDIVITMYSRSKEPAFFNMLPGDEMEVEVGSLDCSFQGNS